MSEDKVFEKIQDIVAKQLGIEAKAIKTDSNFTTDLNADSLDVVELVMSFEEEFDVPIEDEDAGGLTTVQDAIDYIKKLQDLLINTNSALNELLCSIPNIPNEIVKKGKNEIESFNFSVTGSTDIVVPGAPAPVSFAAGLGSTDRTYSRTTSNIDLSSKQHNNISKTKHEGTNYIII